MNYSPAQQTFVDLEEPMVDGEGNVLTRKEFIAAIHLWIANREDDEKAIESLDDSFTPEELGEMSFLARLDVQRKGLVINTIRYARCFPRADIGLAIMPLIFAFSDNKTGQSHLSQRTIAKLLGRSTTTVSAAMKRLRVGQYVAKEPGKQARYTPVIPRVVGSGYNHVAWLTDAVSEYYGETSDSKPTSVPDRVVQRVCTRLTGTEAKFSNSCTSLSDTGQKASVPVEGSPCTRLTGTYIYNSILLNLNAGEDASDQVKVQPGVVVSFGDAANRERKPTTAAKAAAMAGVIAAGVAATALPAAAADAVMAPMEPPVTEMLAKTPQEAAQPVKASSSASGMIDYQTLVAQLEEAAGEAIASPASHPKLLIMADAQAWIANGCDMEQHILPVIRAMSASLLASGKRRTVKSWSYFTGAILQAKATSEAVLEIPKIEPRMAGVPGGPGVAGVAVYGADGSRRGTYRSYDEERREQHERGERAFERVFGKV